MNEVISIMPGNVYWAMDTATGEVYTKNGWDRGSVFPYFFKSVGEARSVMESVVKNDNSRVPVIQVYRLELEEELEC